MRRLATPFVLTAVLLAGALVSVGAARAQDWSLGLEVTIGGNDVAPIGEFETIESDAHDVHPPRRRPAPDEAAWDRPIHDQGYEDQDPAFGADGHFVPEPAILTRRDVLRILRNDGFSGVRNLRRRGEVYVAEAVGPAGEYVRVVVNAETGDIDGLRVLGYR